jgi:Protein of unknown function (DUF2778)
MTWTYSQSAGSVRFKGAIQGQGYSGYGPGRNNPAMEAIANTGPIPKGRYKIGPSYDDEHLGPCVMHLDPIGHDALGRSEFRIHGNNKTNDASHGCIILGPDLRHVISHSEDRELLVVE